jgi:hypothetical protein
MIYKTLQKTKDQATWNQVPRKIKLFLLHTWYLLCFYWYKPGDKSWMSKWPDFDYKRNIKIDTSVGPIEVRIV